MPHTSQQLTPIRRAIVKANDFVAAAHFQHMWHNYRKLMQDADGEIPPLKALTPKVLSNEIPRAILAERLAPTEFVIRMTGSHIDQLLGHDMTGQSVLALSPKDQHQSLLDAYRWINDGKCGLYLTEELRLSDGKIVPIETFALPLTDQDGTVKYTFSLFHFSKTKYDGQKISNSIADHENIISSSIIDLGFGLPRDFVRPK